MVRGLRPKFRWAAQYLVESVGAEGSKLPAHFTNPVYYSYNRVLDLPVPKDEAYTRDEKDWATGGTFVWLLCLIHQNGPLTRREIWARYHEDSNIDKEDVPIRSFTQLKVDYLKRLMEEKMIVNAGYSRLEKRNMGYVVNQKKAFATIHPAILFALNPVPECDLVERFKAAMLSQTVDAKTN